MPPLRKRQAERRDEAVMGTNNSSIVSKRSVERIYFKNEPEFYRHFVKKPQRRSPLINRGYWLRMKAIDHVVRQFLQQPSEKQKVLVNLGCGYDPLPFQCLTRYRESCTGTVFVDVDFMPLMMNKRSIIASCLGMRDLLNNFRFGDVEDPFLLCSDEYLALGCDLRDLTKLGQLLDRQFDPSRCIVLFTAEVSITYMDVDTADALIAWATRYEAAQFCLLEQCLPDGADHPFAQTMLRHFEKLQTALHPIHRYPTKEDQRRRFADAGWVESTVQDLWTMWSDDDFMTAEERLAVNAVEPFDEWEEFILFASHYLCLVAYKTRGPNGKETLAESLGLERTKEKVQLVYQAHPKGCGRRRFGAAFSPDHGAVANHGGMGPISRTSSCDVWVKQLAGRDRVSLAPAGISPRLCHTITPTGPEHSLLVGGRSSPDHALADCWLYDRATRRWVECDPLPHPRYRHSAAALPDGRVLICGGKSDASRVLDDWLLWTAHGGWQTLRIVGHRPPATFGASMFTIATMKGVIFGGMDATGTIIPHCWEWAIQPGDDTAITFQDCLERTKTGIDCFGRFGATLSPTPEGVLVFGGVGPRAIPREEDEILFLGRDLSVKRIHRGYPRPRPLLIGCSAYSTSDITMIFGGGAVCFSFGTHWNDGMWTMAVQHPSQSWKLQEGKVGEQVRGPKTGLEREITDGTTRAAPQQWALNVPRIHMISKDAFETVLQRSHPVIMSGLDLGSCREKWTLQYLKDCINVNRLVCGELSDRVAAANFLQVVIHQAQSDRMNFLSKNFSYVTRRWHDFLDQVDEGERVYLRSLSAEQPIQRPADLARDFPEIAGEFQLPPALSFVKEHAHSSPLRISGPVALWLHYDVMANVLCQVRGQKRLVLYAPSEVRSLQIPAGATSSHLDVFDDATGAYPPLNNAPRHEANLEPGDVLYIPPLWAHAAAPTQGPSIAVNVFFRNLSDGYAAGRDVYGNRDLQAYEKGRLEIARLVRSFAPLPGDVRRFYLERLSDELLCLAHEPASSPS